MTPSLLLQLVSLVIFIVFTSIVNLQRRAKALLTGIYIVLTGAIYLLLNKGILTPFIKNTFDAILIVGLPPLAAVGIAYAVTVRYTLQRNRTRRRK